MKMLILVQFFIAILIIVGWCKCVYKFATCDFKAPYKAEVIYGVGIVSGLGGVIGWFDIKDN